MLYYAPPQVFEGTEYGAMKQTYQPKKRRRARRHGFMKRMATSCGRDVIQRRRRKGRARLAV